MAVTVPVELLISIEKAIKDSAAASNAISQQLQKIDKTADKTNESIGSIAKVGFVAVAAAAVAAGAAIVKAFSSSIEEAIEADDAIQSLTNSLRASGDLSDQNVRAFEDLAEELSSISRFSDDSILAQVRLGKQFGLTNRETEKLLRTSVEYAAFAKEDLGTVVRQLGQTFDGTAGRLAEQIPGLRNLSKESLRAGGALDVVLKQLGGSAAADLNTFSGSLEQAKNRFADIFEELGKGVVGNEAFAQTIRELGEIFKTIAEVIADNGGAIKDFVTGGIIFAADAVGIFAQVLRALDKIFRALLVPVQALAALLEFTFKSLFNLARLDFKNLKDSLNLVAIIERDNKNINDSLATRLKVYDGISEVAASLSVKLQKVANNEKSITANVKQTAAGFDDLVNKNLRLKTTDEERKKAQEERLKLLEEERKIIEDIFQKNQANLKNLTTNPFAAIPGSGDSNRLGLTQSDQETIATGIGGVSAALQGRQGATALLAQGAELAGQAFLGVPGVGQVFSLLAQGPEQVKLLVQQFADAVPDIIVAVAEAIPVVFETLGEKLPEIITRLVENAPRIIAALVKSTPAFVFALTKGIVQAAGRFLEEIVRGAGRFIQELLSGAGRFIESLINALKEGIGKVFDGLNPFSGSNSGVGGLVSGVGDVVRGIAGGIVGLFGKTGPGSGFSPSQIGFSDSAQPVNVSLKIGQREFANAMFDVNRQGFRTS